MRTLGLLRRRLRVPMRSRAVTPAQRAAHDRRAATFATRRAALAEDICWLRDTGEHPERAAQRLGLTPDALAKNIQRLGIKWPAAHTAQSRLRD